MRVRAETLIFTGYGLRRAGSNLLIVLIVVMCAPLKGGSIQAPVKDGLPRGLTMVDPCLGTVWVFETDRDHPARPPRLKRVSQPMLSGNMNQLTKRESFEKSASGTRLKAPRVNAPPADPQIAIQAGQRVVIHQNHDRMQATLEGTALMSASIGGKMLVRLKFAGVLGRPGQVIEAVAIGVGHAQWTAQRAAKAQ